MSEKKNRIVCQNCNENKEEEKERVKIVSVEWCNNEKKTVKEISYNNKVIIKVTTENLEKKEISISVFENKKNKKVDDWDKAKENDIVLKATVNENVATVEFTPKDEWFSKGAKDKQIIALVSYDEEKANKSSSVLTVKRVDYNKDMKASENGLRFTAHFEALAMICPDGKIRAYQDGGCGKGVWTVGIGEAATSGTIDANTVIETEIEAWNRFANKMKGSYTAITRSNLKEQGVKRKLEQYEFDALVDFTYNVGNCVSIAKEIAEETNMTESVFLIKGQTDRRKSEFKLFSGETVVVAGYKKFYRKDNTNGGYCPIQKQVQETQKVTKDGKTIDEPVFETIEGKKVPKMKTVSEQGWYAVNSKETYTLQY